MFGRHVFIFSDKYCEFPNTGDTKLDWQRWFRRAVFSSAKQVRGAERWIRKFPDRLFVDAACTKPFPISLPSPSEAKYHRIVVAHGAGPRCQLEMGGSGSLVMLPEVVGDEKPFAIGILSAGDAYVHVVDDFTLDAILRTVNTVTDLAQYLERKEEFVISGKLKIAAGEEEILAYYLKRVDENGLHCFEVPPEVEGVLIEKGHWDSFQKHPDRLAQLEADRISYAWDALIDEFAKNILEETQYLPPTASISEQEIGLRLMASEVRTRRRMLANSLREVLERADKLGRAAKVILPLSWTDPCYVLLALQWPEDKSEKEYRSVRQALLESYCMVVRSQYSEARSIVGIATESRTTLGRIGRSEDLIYLDGTQWTDELQLEAEDRRTKLDILQELRPYNISVSEYPQGMESKHGRDRNKPCPCGSGRKLKRCHGSRHRH